jgi:hypothetical protein
MSIEKIFPVGPQKVTITLVDGAEDTVEVREFTIGQLPRVLQLSKTVYGHVSAMGQISQDQVTSLMTDLLSTSGDELFEMIGLSINRDRAWFNLVPIDAAIDLLKAFIEVNLSFFVHRVLPKFQTSMDSLRSSMTGQTQ